MNTSVQKSSAAYCKQRQASDEIRICVPSVHSSMISRICRIKDDFSIMKPGWAWHTAISRSSLDFPFEPMGRPVFLAVGMSA